MTEKDDIPLEELADEIASEDEPEDDLFTEEVVPDLDAEVVWEELEADSDEPLGGTDAGVRTIPKAVYCQQCEYFEEPPAMACTHEGTDILELVDMEHLKVQNCPIIARDEELGQVREAPSRR